MVTCVLLSLVTTAVRPVGKLATLIFPAPTKLSPLFPVKVVPEIEAVRVVVMEPLLSVLSMNVPPE